MLEKGTKVRLIPVEKLIKKGLLKRENDDCCLEDIHETLNYVEDMEKYSRVRPIGTIGSYESFYDGYRVHIPSKRSYIWKAEWFEVVEQEIEIISIDWEK